MYDQIREDTLFIILYSVVTAMAMMASCYLLSRRGNAFATDIKTPAHLRRWTAVFLAAFALNHVWYMPIFFLSSSEDIRLCDLVGGLLDSMTIFPLAIIVLLAMLQDRRRPIWPVAVMFVPLAVGNALCVATLSYDFLPVLYLYLLMMGMGIIIYMVRALRQYGRWLRDNYADLEHKEVWQSLLVLAVIMFLFVYYVMGYGSITYEYIIQVSGLLLIGHLLWRVETLADLSISQSPSSETISDATYEQIGALLKQQCEDTQLFLQHDLTLSHLAHALGTNRTYLGMYFSRQGTTYNAYINDLRIDCFVRLVREANAAQRPFTAQELAAQSGYRSYRTFSVAFRERKGQSVTAWMNEEESA